MDLHRTNTRLLPIGETAKLLGVSIDTLRSWDAKGVLTAFRPDPKGNRYYLKEDIENFTAKKTTQDHMTLALQWSKGRTPGHLPSEFYCETADVFSARLQSLNQKLERQSGLEKISSLITAVIGEVGNNSFNHNLGSWPDVPGIFFAYDLKKRRIILADRGQGVLKTLRRVLPKLKTDSEALKVAFTKYVSGRAPENRGNGLKFVRDVVFTHPIQLQFFSGNAGLELNRNDKKIEVRQNKTSFHGSIAIISH